MLASVAGGRTAESVANPTAAVPLAEDGTQVVVVAVSDGGYSPSVLRVKAGVRTRLTFRTQGTQGCTRTLVVPSLKLGRQLPVTGDTTIDLGMLAPSRLRYGVSTSATSVRRNRTAVTYDPTRTSTTDITAIGGAGSYAAELVEGPAQ